MNLNLAYLKISILSALLEQAFVNSNDYFVLESFSEFRKITYTVVCHFNINSSSNNNINIRSRS